MIDKYKALNDAQKAMVLRVIGIIIMLPALIRGFSGFYNSDLVWMVPLFVVGGVFLFVSTKIKDRATET